MIGGQVVDLAAQGETLTLDQLQWLSDRKTASLICCAVEFGGVIGQATTAQMAALSQFGERIGLAFQVVDDILDVTSSSEILGKTDHSDQANAKPTYASALGVDKARAYAQELYERALEALAPISNSSRLQTIAMQLVERIT